MDIGNLASSLAWHFVQLSDDQLQRRRKILDFYGQLAQVSIIPMLLVIALVKYEVVSKIIKSLIWRTFQPNLSSDGQECVDAAQDHRPAAVAAYTRPRASKSVLAFGSFYHLGFLYWWLDEPLFSQGTATRKQWLIACLWTGWLSFLSIHKTEGDYLHLTKRAGTIAASQLPLHFLLAVKSGSPIQFATRLSHEELNVYHSFLGWIIGGLMTVHAALYLNFYIQIGLMSKRLRDADVQLGLSALASSVALFTATIDRVRRWNYRVFFYTHVALSVLLLPLLYWHVEHIRLVIIECGLVYAWLIYKRNSCQIVAQANIRSIEGTNLISISIPLNERLEEKRFLLGQHVYISIPKLSQKLRLNPFSIVNNPAEARHLQLVMRALHGTTAILSSKANESGMSNLVVEGPYGAAKYFPNFKDEAYNRILLVAGGVGATFIIPMFEQIFGQTRAQKGTRIVLLWSVKNLREAIWGLRLISRITENEASTVDTLHGKHTHERIRIEIYITAFCPPTDQVLVRETIGATTAANNGIHHTSYEPSASELILLKDIKFCQSSVTLKRGRPGFAKIIKTMTSASFSEAELAHPATTRPIGQQMPRMAILVCGPQGMATSLRQDMDTVKANRRLHVWWHNEQFSF